MNQYKNIVTKLEQKLAEAKQEILKQDFYISKLEMDLEHALQQFESIKYSKTTSKEYQQQANNKNCSISNKWICREQPGISSIQK